MVSVKSWKNTKRNHLSSLYKFQLVSSYLSSGAPSKITCNIFKFVFWLVDSSSFCLSSSLSWKWNATPIIYVIYLPSCLQICFGICSVITAVIITWAAILMNMLLLFIWWIDCLLLKSSVAARHPSLPLRINCLVRLCLARIQKSPESENTCMHTCSTQGPIFNVM